LAWVLEEVRKSLDGAVQALRRFVRDADLALGTDLASLDTSHLRIARQQLHQAEGALEMVGMGPAASVLRAMEAVVQRFVQRPELCVQEQAVKVERAGFALIEYLEAVLRAQPVSPVALFAQCRDLLEIVLAPRIHPADLWPVPWRWLEIDLEHGHGALVYDDTSRARFDQAILKFIKTGDPGAAATLHSLCLGLSAAQGALAPRTFWILCAAFFDALGRGWLPNDRYVKRTASRVLTQYIGLVRGDLTQLDRLAHDLLFYCDQAAPHTAGSAPALAAVLRAYGLPGTVPVVDYEARLFGRFDPALLTQARKRIALAKELWAALAGGDTQKLRSAADQFGLVCESLVKLDPASHPLAQALTAVMDATVRSAQAPTPQLAMEVATSVLYLEAAYQDMNPGDRQRVDRFERLAQRLDGAARGADPEALETWMEELYRRVSERQNMGSVVSELGVTMGLLEKSLDQFFRKPMDKTPLQQVPGQLAQMRGVLSLLGLDQASQAVLHMRDSVQQILLHPVDDLQTAASFEHLGNSLGALGFMVDMLNYQPALARQMFVFDPALGEFRSIMGRAAPMAPAAARPPPALPAVARPDAAVDDDAELRQVFLDEAQEVLKNGLSTLDALVQEPSDIGLQTTLRRAFHTLKGSARMVGFAGFGEAAWSLEQLLNGRIAEQQSLSPDVLAVSLDAMHGLQSWLSAIVTGTDARWRPEPFRAMADAMRRENRRLPLDLDLDAAPIVSANLPESKPLPTGAQVPAAEVVEPGFAALSEPTAVDDTVALDLAARVDVVAEGPRPAVGAEAEVAPEPEEEVKVIGGLRIGIPLYNVYLNEADEWSRRLMTEIDEWTLELHRPVADSTVALAHSLAGSSATVGFRHLSSLARELEHALEHVQLLGQGEPRHGQVFTDAAQDIRLLLHQFAAGFVKEADPNLLRALKALQDVPLPESSPGLAPALLAAPVNEVAPAVAAVDVAEAELPDQPVAALPAGGAPEEPAAVASSALLTPIVSAADAKANEIDVQDVIDPELFPIFEEEALALLPRLAGALRQWSARPENVGARAEVLRALHTFKGGARLAGAMRLGEMAHRMESSIEDLGATGLQAHQVEPLLTRYDALHAHFLALRPSGELPFAAPAGVLPEPIATVPGLAGAGVRAAALQSVRVRPQLLDRLINQAGEVVMTRSRLESGLTELQDSLGELTGNLDRLRQQLRDLELQAETQMQSRLAQSREFAQDFDPLEFDRFTRVQELTRMMAESVGDVATVQRSLQRGLDATAVNLVAQARQTRELQRDLLRTRMVEFESIAERLYGVVRQAGKDSGKQVRLDIVGGSIEMDRSVLERMTPAFEHLLRNAVGHGIEDGAMRLGLGKDATGSVTIRLNQEGNDVSVEFVDDGAGLNLQVIRERAQELGLSSDGQALSDEQAANLIFHPGFSTAARLTELAGRGIGMDVVRSEVAALGGRIETFTETGRGARFRLILPLTTAVTQVVVVRVGAVTFGVPANLVEMVRRVKPLALSQAYSTGWFEDELGQLPFFWLGVLLRQGARSQELASKNLSVMVVRSAGQRVAVHVDEVLGNREVVVKSLGPQLARLPALAALTVLASGAVVLVYNPVALATVYGESARAASTQEPADALGQVLSPAASAAPVASLVLVVDDSITVRRVTQRLLAREGYRVALAADGRQALELLQQERPAVVLSDIEMPVMDGFELVRKIRADEHLRNIPIIMITSRIADKHRQHAKELGVNHYLGKPYPEEELLTLVRGCCPARVAE
jgi:chemosensory pili system protein ChpA (sensor histidine kinase/response regulator)